MEAAGALAPAAAAKSAGSCGLVEALLLNGLEAVALKNEAALQQHLWQRAAEPLWMYWKAALEAMDGGRNRDLLPLCRGRRPQQAVAECSRCS